MSWSQIETTLENFGNLALNWDRVVHEVKRESKLFFLAESSCKKFGLRYYLAYLA